jgi:hypothetical protein
VPVERGMDRTLRRNAHIAIQPPDQKLADLAGTPMRLVALEADDRALDLGRHWLAYVRQVQQIDGVRVSEGAAQ